MWTDLVPVLPTLLLLVVSTRPASAIHADLCEYVAVANEPMTFTCPVATSNCTANYTAVAANTTWCFRNSPTFSNIWMFCLNQNEVTEKSGGDPASGIEDVVVQPSGDVLVPLVQQDYGGFVVTCSVLNEEGGLCEEGFDLLVYTPGPGPIPQLKPPVIQTATDATFEFIVGRKATLVCFEGEPVGANGTAQWKKTGSSLSLPPTLTLSQEDASSCLACNCVDDLLSAIASSSSSSSSSSLSLSSRFVSFVVYGTKLTDSTAFTRECLNIPRRFVSFAVISDITAEDGGSYEFSISSGYSTLSHAKAFTLQPGFEDITPTFELTESGAQQLEEGSSEVFLCNATFSMGAELTWMKRDDDSSSANIEHLQNPFLESNDTVDFNSDVLCDFFNISEPFAVYPSESVSVYLSTVDADVQTLSLALVFCRIQPSFAGSYVCSVSDHAQTSAVVQLSVILPVIRIVRILVPTVVAAILVLVLVTLAAVAFGLWKKKWDKNQPVRMTRVEDQPLYRSGSRRISSGYQTVPFLIAQTMHGLDIDDPREFPRDQLELLEVLGEGQFGQVRKARAAGICSDSNRDTVAVKMLKPNAGPGDVDDLYKELEIMRNMEPHPNIVNFLRHCSQTSELPLFILMEFAVFGSLKEYLKTVRKAKLKRPSLQSSPDPFSTFRGGGGSLATYAGVGGGGGGSLCPNHSNPTTPYPSSAQQNDSSSSPVGTRRLSSGGVFDFNPVAFAHSRRLLLLLQSDEAETDTNPHEYYNRLGCGQCAYRPCLDQYPHQNSEYASSMDTAQEYYNSYYNYRPSGATRGGEEGEGGGTPGAAKVVGGPPQWEANGRVPSLSTSEAPYPSQSAGACGPAPLHATSSMCSYCSQGGDPANIEDSAPQHHHHHQGAAAGGGDIELAGRGASDGGLTYFDVLDFANQIARGMEHLEKMKCVHRDLAARNILIAEGFLLKVGDFGLARDLSEKDYYRKLTAGKIPARWMALESLEERTHTSKSDVWSYGIVLWEILTYGGLPYGRSPAAGGVESLCAYIKSGHRLSQPRSCTNDIYSLMRRCWEADPDRRPCFSQLVRTFDDIMTLAQDSGYLTALNIEEVAQSPETRNIEADIIANLSTPTPSHSRGGISYNEALELAISHQTHPSPLLSSRHTSISTLPDHVLSRHTSLSAPPDHHHHAPLHARCSLDGVANKLSLNSQSSTGGRPQHQDHHLTSTPHHPLLLTRSSSDRVSKQASITSQTSNNNQHRPPFYQQETHSPSSLLYHPNTAESNSGLAPPSPAEAVGPNSYMSLIADSPAATPSDGNAANSTPSTDQEEVMTLVVCEPSSSSPPSSSSSSLGQQEGVAGTGPDRRDGGGGGREAPLLTSTPSAASDLPFTEVPVMRDDDNDDFSRGCLELFNLSASLTSSRQSDATRPAANITPHPPLPPLPPHTYGNNAQREEPDLTEVPSPYVLPNGTPPTPRPGCSNDMPPTGGSIRTPPTPHTGCSNGRPPTAATADLEAEEEAYRRSRGRAHSLSLKKTEHCQETDL